MPKTTTLAVLLAALVGITTLMPADAFAQSETSITGGNGSVAPPVSEVEKWRKAADRGDAIAQYQLGIAYGSGDGVPQSSSRAVAWILQAAEQGFVDAQFTLGVSYDTGDGVPVDKVQAARWFLKAAEQGDAEAQFNMGNAYSLGEG